MPGITSKIAHLLLTLVPRTRCRVSVVLVPQTQCEICGKVVCIGVVVLLGCYVMWKVARSRQPVLGQAVF